MSNSGVQLAPSTNPDPRAGAGYQGYLRSPSSVAVDGSGDVWVNSNYASGTSYSFYLGEMVGAAAPVVTPLSVGVKNNTLGTRP